MKQSKKYQEYKNNNIQNLVNHSQGDQQLVEEYEEGQKVDKKLGKDKSKITNKNSIY